MCVEEVLTGDSPPLGLSLIWCIWLYSSRLCDCSTVEALLKDRVEDVDETTVG